MKRWNARIEKSSDLGLVARPAVGEGYDANEGDRVVVMAAEDAEEMERRHGGCVKLLIDHDHWRSEAGEWRGKCHAEREAGRVEAAEAIAAWLESDDATGLMRNGFEAGKLTARQLLTEAIMTSKWRARLPKP